MESSRGVQGSSEGAAREQINEIGLFARVRRVTFCTGLRNIYTPNLGPATTISNSERERGRFRGSSKGANRLKGAAREQREALRGVFPGE